MKKYSNFFIVLLSSIILLFIFIKKSIVTSTIILSLSIWLNTLVPSMFPMFVLSDILINYNFIEYIPSKITNFVSKVFNLSKNAILVLFLSLISGFPSNARNIKSAYDKKIISLSEAEHLLLFNHFANPLFVIETVGNIFLKNNIFGIIILFSHIMSNCIIAIIFRKKNIPSNVNNITINNESQSFGNILSNSVKKSIDSLFMVAGIATLFLILSTLVTNIFSLNDTLSFAIKSVLEMTMGLSFLSSLDVGNVIKVVLSTIIISFGGLSVHLQVISALGSSGIKYYNYLKGRIIGALISGVIAFSIMLVIG